MFCFHLIDKHPRVQRLKLQKPRGKLRRYDCIFRHAQLFRVEYRPVRSLPDGSSEPRYTEHQNRLVGLFGHDRLMARMRL